MIERRKNGRNVAPVDFLKARSDALFSEAKKFCRKVGLPTDLISTIAKQDSDWAFIIKIDALLEMATKELVRDSLCFEMLKGKFQNDKLADFVDSLPINGRLSIVALMNAMNCPTEDVGFVEATRRVRNAYAHDIKLVDVALIDVIKLRGDRSELLKKLSSIAKFDEAKLIADYEKDPNFLRFCILDAAMRVLFFAYHVALKGKRKRKRD